MKIVLFQGNFPKQYQGTRHNVAFALADSLAGDFGAIWTNKPKFFAEICEVQFAGEKLILVKPTTYYNETGKAARAICDFYKVDYRKDFLVFCDDVALDFGVLRARAKGSDGGNNGLKSLISTFGQEFLRVRIGVANELLARMDTADFVLGKFSRAEQNELAKVFAISRELLEAFCRDELSAVGRSV